MFIYVGKCMLKNLVKYTRVQEICSKFSGEGPLRPPNSVSTHFINGSDAHVYKVVTYCIRT